jgi:LacI family transcriptional regulator
LPRSGRRTRNVVTITDVAREAGVSPMTVSRVVNAESNVSPATRERVERAVRALNYAPNVAARSLAKAAAVRVGVIYSNPSAHFLSEFLLGVLDRTQTGAVQLLLQSCGEGDEEERQAVTRLAEAGAQGVILPPPHSESAVVRRELRERGLRAAVVAAGRPPVDTICVRVDDRRAAYEMTRRLLALGHRRLGFIGGHPNQSSSRERYDGFITALEGAPGAEHVFVQGHFDFVSGLSAAEQLLDAAERPTAVFASNDDMATAVVSVAHRRGMSVPEDLTVVGFDDTALATTHWPPLTTVRQPVREMAATAMELLVEALTRALDGEEPEPVDRVLPYEVMERQSSAPPSPTGSTTQLDKFAGRRR